MNKFKFYQQNLDKLKLKGETLKEKTLADPEDSPIDLSEAFFLNFSKKTLLKLGALVLSMSSFLGLQEQEIQADKSPPPSKEMLAPNHPLFIKSSSLEASKSAPSEDFQFLPESKREERQLTSMFPGLETLAIAVDKLSVWNIPNIHPAVKEESIDQEYIMWASERMFDEIEIKGIDFSLLSSKNQTSESHNLRISKLKEITPPNLPELASVEHKEEMTEVKITLLSQAGVVATDWEYVNYIIYRESGWRYNLWNHQGSSAYGLCQRMMSVHKLEAGERYMYDPIAQLQWCDTYAHKRYDSWEGAYNFWKKNHWW